MNNNKLNKKIIVVIIARNIFQQRNLFNNNCGNTKNIFKKNMQLQKNL